MTLYTKKWNGVIGFNKIYNLLVTDEKQVHERIQNNINTLHYFPNDSARV